MSNNNGANPSGREKDIERLLAINNDLLGQLIGQQAFIRGELETILLALPAFSLSGETLKERQMDLAKALLVAQGLRVKEANKVIRAIYRKRAK